MAAVGVWFGYGLGVEWGTALRRIEEREETLSQRLAGNVEEQVLAEKAPHDL